MVIQNQLKTQLLGVKKKIRAMGNGKIDIVIVPIYVHDGRVLRKDLRLDENITRPPRKDAQPVKHKTVEEVTTIECFQDEKCENIEQLLSSTHQTNLSSDFSFKEEDTEESNSRKMQKVGIVVEKKFDFCLEVTQHQS